MWLHFCSLGCCAAADSAMPGGPARSRGAMTIDLHCHVLTPEVEALIATTPQKQAEPGIMRRAMGTASVEHNFRVMLPAAFPKLTHIETRLADMDAMGVDLQVLSPSPNQYCYWADAALADEIVRLQNERIAGLVLAYPTRLAGLGTVALQHPALAVLQLTRAVGELGLKGVEISTSINGIELDDPTLAPFWAAAEALGAIVFIHPFGTTLGDRVATHYLNNIIGQPLETTIALSRLIFGGVLDAHPALKIVAAHGGGYLPTSIGRSNHGWQVRPEAGVNCRRPPIDYLRSIFFDTVVYEPLALRHLIDAVGASQVVVGTDYPYDMGHYEPHRLIASIPGITPEEQSMILGGTAQRLLGLTEI